MDTNGQTVCYVSLKSSTGTVRPLDRPQNQIAANNEHSHGDSAHESLVSARNEFCPELRRTFGLHYSVSLAKSCSKKSSTI